MKNAKQIKLTDNALTVLKRRYLLKDSDGRIIETPKELFERVANFIAQADRNYGADNKAVERTAESFYNMMAALEFLPNSPTLMNAGKELGQLSACFVIPVGDSMLEIFEANKQAALIHQSGGGTGFAFSRLRPRNSIVASTSGIASGPVSFMKVFNASTEAVKQGGTRRGANMGILRIDHPDILEFISCKDQTYEITNFNISVAVTDKFMEAVANDTHYNLIDPRTNDIYQLDGEPQSLNARDVFSDIIEHAWRTGEPGIVFIDRMNRRNPTYPYETIEATNPCGEQPLPPFDSCNLGSINLGQFVCEPKEGKEDGFAIIDWPRLATAVHTAVHFLDNVIDQNRYPLPEIEAQTRRNRRIGLGVMGWADLVARLSLSYDSAEALELGERVMTFVEEEARKHSSELAKTRGKFPNWENSVYASEGVAMRNATVTTIAPTGTISIIAGCSSGIEPFYSIAFERNVLDGTRMTEVNPIFEQVAREAEILSDDLITAISSKRSLAEIDNLPEHIKKIFRTAADISPENHIKMQAVFQKHCDSSVSKTINLPESASVADVRAAFELAWEEECKGVTVYRDNSRPNQVLSTGQTKVEADLRHMQSRPTLLNGITEKIRTGYGNLYVTVNTVAGRPFEVFAHIGHSGYTTMADTEAICRLISLALRSGVAVGDVIRQLRGIGGSSQVFSSGARVLSIPDAIAQVLNRHFGGEGTAADQSESSKAEICPECGSGMAFLSGCFSCSSCGYSNC